MNTEKMEERLLGERLQELEEGELAEALEAAIEDETELTEERLLDDVLREASSCSKRPRKSHSSGRSITQRMYDASGFVIPGKRRKKVSTPMMKSINIPTPTLTSISPPPPSPPPDEEVSTINGKYALYNSPPFLERVEPHLTSLAPPIFLMEFVSNN